MRVFRRRAPLPDEDALELAHETLRYRIRASRRRRTLSLELRADGSLTVAAPAALPLAVIREFVAGRQRWIGAKRALLAAHRPAPFAFVSGARLPLLDETLTLVLHPGRARCRREGAALVVHAPDEAGARRAVEAWCRREAEAHARRRIAHFAPQVGRAPGRIAIRAQRTRWGSCTSRGTVSLNWRLMQMPAAVFDYVVVHELCHLRVPNHSPRFWAEVARVLPDHRERRAALRRCARGLLF